MENIHNGQKKPKVFLHPDETWDRHFRQLGRIERMLKWLVIDSIIVDEERLAHTDKGLELKKQLPDISDIIEGK